MVFNVGVFLSRFVCPRRAREGVFARTHACGERAAGGEGTVVGDWPGLYSFVYSSHIVQESTTRRRHLH